MTEYLLIISLLFSLSITIQAVDIELKIGCEILSDSLFIDDQCIVIRKTVLKYDEAHLSCDQLPNGHLAILKDQNLIKIINQKFKYIAEAVANSNSSWWIGLSQDIGSSSPNSSWNWKWPDGRTEIENDIKWRENEPNDENGIETNQQNCARLLMKENNVIVNSTIIDSSCTELHYLVCQYESPRTDLEYKCHGLPKSFYAYDSCIVMDKSLNTNYQKAMVSCDDLPNGHLVITKDEQMIALIKQHFDQHILSNYNARFWVGLKKKNSSTPANESWIGEYPDGREQPLTTVPWRAGEPNGINGQQLCAISLMKLSYIVKDGKLEDVPCTNSYWSICQYDHPRSDLEVACNSLTKSFYYNDRCIELQDTVSKTYNAARYSCNSLPNGQLTIPKDAEEIGMIERHFGKYATDYNEFWYLGWTQNAGATSPHLNWQIGFPDGTTEPASSIPWTTAEPNDVDGTENNQADCVTMSMKLSGSVRSPAAVEDKPCTAGRNFLCQYAPPESVFQSKCHSLYPSYMKNGTCYALDEHKVNFDDAMSSKCHELANGQLAVAHSQPIIDMLGTWFYSYRASTSYVMWLGLKRFETTTPLTEGWRWLTSEGFNDTTPVIWRAPDPNGNGITCGGMWYQNPPIGIVDDDCAATHYSICQYNDDHQSESFCINKTGNVPKRLSCNEYYYFCENGTTSYQRCPGNLKFDPDTLECREENQVRACACLSKGLSRAFLEETDSCIYTVNLWTNWKTAFELCQDNGKASGSVGRLAHITTEAAKEAMEIIATANEWIGLHSTKITTNASDFNWFSSTINPNYLKSFNESLVPQTLNGEQCAQWVKATKTITTVTCSSVSTRTFCEEFFNSCHLVQCPYPKVCFADTPRAYHCICPPGWTGNNCDEPKVEEACILQDAVYDLPSDSCFKKGSITKNWNDSFDYCSSEMVPFVNYTARLGHITNTDIWNNIITKYPNINFWTGHHAMVVDTKNVSEWKWMITNDNPNGAKTTTFTTALVDYNAASRDCGAVYYSNKFSDYWPCTKTLLPMCEFIVDTCYVQSIDCGPYKKCISDSPNTYQCICPVGWSGTNCETPDVQFACGFYGFIYEQSTESCFKLPTTTKNWHDGYDYCSSDMVPFDNYTGRLAHITNANIWNNIITKYPNTHFWTGHRAMIIDTNNENYWKWMITKDNPNGAKNTTFATTVVDYSRLNTDCGAVYQSNRFIDYWKCTQTSIQPMCEIIADTCHTQSIDCGPFKKCVSDSPNTYQCICSAGWTGTNCETPDMQYVCGSQGWIYEESTESCFKLATGITKKWNDSFDYCSSDMPFDNYTGRLAHITNANIWNNIITKYPNTNFWTGHHAMIVDTKNVSEWKWMITNDNPNGAKPTTFTTSLVDYNRPNKDCGAVYYSNKFSDNWLCTQTLRPMCEMLADTCHTQSIDCGPFKKCVSDSPNTYQCICPSGWMGTNCETRDLNTLCPFYGLVYEQSTESCFQFFKGTATNWHDSFDYCRQTSPFEGFIGRLAHFRTKAAFDKTAYPLMASYYTHTGHRRWDRNSVVDDYFWVLDNGNPNAVVTLDDSVKNETWLLDQVNSYCGARGVPANMMHDDFCATARTPKMCEYLIDLCVNVTCSGRKVCVPDTPLTYECVCPAGFTGENCEEYDVSPLCTLLDKNLYSNKTASNTSCFSVNKYSYIKTWDWMADKCEQEAANGLETRLMHITSYNLMDYAKILSTLTSVAAPVIGTKCNSTTQTCALEDTGKPSVPVHYIPDGSTLGARPVPACTKFHKGSLIWQSGFSCATQSISQSAICEHFIPSACDSNPCQGFGVCHPIYPNNFTCECPKPYYGENCENSCPDMWSNFTKCTRECDYGWKYSHFSEFHDDQMNNYCPTSATKFEPCGETPCQNYLATRYSPCNGKNALFTSGECFFVVTSPNALQWNQAFDLCKNQRGQLAHLYDTKYLFDAIWAYLLKYYDNQTVWIGAKAIKKGDGSSFVYWMKDPMNVQEKAIMGHSLTALDLNETCYAYQLARTINSSVHFPFTTHKLPCYQIIGAIEPKHALCMIKTPYAEYNMTKKTFIDDVSGGLMTSTMAQNSWYCGLECRKSEVCQAYNYNKYTQQCQLLKVKSTLPTEISSGPITNQLYQMKNDQNWNLFERKY